MGAVIEYLVVEVMDLAVIAAQEDNRKRVIPRHIMLAINNDAELCNVCKVRRFLFLGTEKYSM